MAMNEDSVVSSLNELRRMANDRARREAADRAKIDAERRAWDDGRGRGGSRQTRARQTTGYGNGHDMPVPMQTEPYGQAQYQAAAGYSHQTVTPEWGQPHAMTPQTHAVTEPVVRAGRRGAAGPVFVTMVLAAIAGGAGYLKITQQHRLEVAGLNAEIVELRASNSKAVEAASRAEQQAKVAVAKAKKDALPAPAAAVAAAPAAGSPAGAAAAAAPAAGGGSAPAAAAVAPAPKPAAVATAGGKPSGAAARAAAKRQARAVAKARRASAAAKAERALAPLMAAPKEEKKPAASGGPLPGIAKKKKVTDDPLDGLKL